MTTAFRPGDRVRTVKETWGEAHVPVGAVGTVTDPEPSLAVFFDHDPRGDGTGVWAMLAHDIEHLGANATARELLRRDEGEPMLLLHALGPYASTPAPQPREEGQ